VWTVAFFEVQDDHEPIADFRLRDGVDPRVLHKVPLHEIEEIKKYVGNDVSIAIPRNAHALNQICPGRYRERLPVVESLRALRSPGELYIRNSHLKALTWEYVKDPADVECEGGWAPDIPFTIKWRPSEFPDMLL
jgi:hypothetical protein